MTIWETFAGPFFDQLQNDENEIRLHGQATFPSININQVTICLHTTSRTQVIA